MYSDGTWTLASLYLHPAMSLSVYQAKPHHFSHQTDTSRLLFERPHSLSLRKRRMEEQEGGNVKTRCENEKRNGAVRNHAPTWRRRATVVL